MSSTYNPYSDIQKVYNAKVGWNNATTDEERQKQSEIATAARKNLEAYGYGDIASQVSASGADATAVRKIMENYAPTAPTSTKLSNTELINTQNNEIRNKTNQLWGMQESDRQNMAEKYNKLEETAYSNPFDTDEAKAILAKYDLSGLQARNNAVASGGSSNGGNIDSYAASNALRQQAALVNQGQMTVLDAHNNKINNIKGILESLGVYQQNQDIGMQNTITSQQSESQRLFDNEETAKNNDVERKTQIASVTGYVPSEWAIKNDDIYSLFLNEDGSFKKDKEDVDIQALIDQAKENGDTETAKKLAVVRTRKIFGNYGEYGQYATAGDIATMTPQKTVESSQFDDTMQYNRDVLAAEQANKTSGISAARLVSGGSYSSGSSSSKSGAKPTLTAAQARDALKSGVVTQDVIDAYNYYYGTNYTVENYNKTNSGATTGNPLTSGAASETDYQANLDKVYENSDKTVKDYIRNRLEPLITENSITETELKEHLISNSKDYDIETKDLKSICKALGIDAKWVDDYKDSGLFGWGSGVKER